MSPATTTVVPSDVVFAASAAKPVGERPGDPREPRRRHCGTVGDGGDVTVVAVAPVTEGAEAGDPGAAALDPPLRTTVPTPMSSSVATMMRKMRRRPASVGSIPTRLAIAGGGARVTNRTRTSPDKKRRWAALGINNAVVLPLACVVSRAHHFSHHPLALSRTQRFGAIHRAVDSW